MNDRDSDLAAGTLRSMVIECEELLPAIDTANIWEFIDMGELGIAFETICAQLYEHDLTVTKANWLAER
jgi:hypothetical protein